MTEGDIKLTPRQKASLRKLTDARERLQTAIQDLDQETMSSIPIIADWTIKDLLGHIVSWNREFRTDIAMILAGLHPGYDHILSEAGDFNDSNQVWVAEKRDWTLARILQDLEQDYTEAVDLIMRLQPNEFRLRGVTPWKPAAVTRPPELTKQDTDSIETLVNFHWRHMNMHIRQIENWRKQRVSEEDSTAR